MKVVRIKKSDLDRLIKEQVGGLNAVNLGKKVYDFGKSLVSKISSDSNSTEDDTNPLPFTPENLEKEIIKLNIVYPDVAMAQAKWESAHFKSDVFKENNNVFGMKLALQRDTTAVGKNRGHAKYNNWQDSVKDYKLWQDSNGMSKLPKEKYINKLSNVYCPPPDCKPGSYSKNIKSMLR